MDEASWFGARLRELREQAGLTQQQLADKCGVKWEAVSRWERGTREPGWSNVVALAEALGVECTAFLQELAPALPAGPGWPRKPRAPSNNRSARAAAPGRPLPSRRMSDQPAPRLRRPPTRRSPPPGKKKGGE